jgi:hypothetical protein
MRRYWVMRSSRGKRDLFWTELRAGRLRQGWGYSRDQDLRIIQKALVAKKAIDEDQQNTWRGNRRILETEPDSIQRQDLIISPHLPDEGKWSISEVIGKYRYEIVAKVKDFGHILPVKLRSSRAIDPNEQAVSASLRQTMRNQLRLWNIDYLGAEVDSLLNAVKEAKVSIPLTSPKRLADIQESLDKAAGDAFSKHFQSAEFEEPCVQLLKKIFGEEHVEHTGGRNERGADAICSYNDALGSRHRIAVQIKMWAGQAESTRPLEQVRQAYDNYEGITSAVIFSTAEKCTKDFEKAREKLEKELHTPVRVVYRKELMRLFITHLQSLTITET